MPRSFISGNIRFEFSVYCPCSVLYIKTESLGGPTKLILKPRWPDYNKCKSLLFECSQLGVAT
jgi:hypothetical protein